MVAIVEEIPLTRVWKKLADDEATFEVMMVEVPTEPPMLEVMVLVDTVRELVVRMLGATRLVTVALVAARLVKIEVSALSAVAKKDVEVAEVETRLLVTRVLETDTFVAEALLRYA